jgi:hypothetical protein
VVAAGATIHAVMHSVASECWRRPVPAGSGLLLLASASSAAAALTHVAIIAGGPSWYRFFGAGEGMARLAASGSWYPATITLGIALVLAVWAAYAASAAGYLPVLPFLKTVMVAVSAVYLCRGVGGFFLAALAPGGNSPTFWVWSSCICLLIGLAHAVGLSRRWPVLSARGRHR